MQPPQEGRTAAVLSAVILAACVAAAGAVAPSEEWAERFRLLEARFEQSEARFEQSEARFEQSEQRGAALHKRVAFLEGEVQRLRPSREQAEVTTPKVWTTSKLWTSTAAVGSMGEPEAGGRRLSAPTCCRWTADDTCGSVAADRFEQCTFLHEHLEAKTTTHEFDDLDTCLGSDESKWSVKYDGASTNQVTLSNDATVASLKTPLKVTHAADCGNVPPTLNVQMDTVHDGSLTVGGNTVHSFGDLARKSELDDLARKSELDDLAKLSDIPAPPTSPQLLFRYDWPGTSMHRDDNRDNWHTFGSNGAYLTHTPTLTKASTLLFVHYKISCSTDWIACRLKVNGAEQKSTRSINKGGYVSVTGTWIGALGPGSPEIKAECRASGRIDLSLDFHTKALTVAIIG